MILVSCLKAFTALLLIVASQAGELCAKDGDPDTGDNLSLLQTSYAVQQLPSPLLQTAAKVDKKTHSSSGTVPSFIVNLDEPPEKRWISVTKYYKAELLAMAQTLDPILDKALGDEKQTWLDTVNFGSEYDAELQGIVETVNHTDFTFPTLKLYQLLYELQSPTLCSGVLWATENGTVLHGRNMDYGFHFKMPDGRILNWPDVTFEFTLVKGGKPLIAATGWPGGIGFDTAMRFNGWSFQQNTRSSKNEWRNNLEAAKKGGLGFELQLRTIMERTSDFKEAVKQITATKFMAPQYFIMSGAAPFQGAVLTIDRLAEHLPDTPPIQMLHIAPDSDDWYLVQTNDDLLSPPRDPRRPLANLENRLISRSSASPERLMQFMTTSALKNHNTVYTSVMVPATGHFRTVLPNPPDPLSFSMMNKQRQRTLLSAYSAQ